MPRFPIALFLMLWLPLHGVAAVAMPFCSQPHPADGPRQDAGAQHEHHHHSERAATAKPADPSASKHVIATHASHAGGDAPHLQCDGCGPCHLACSPMVGVTVSPLVFAGSQQHPPLAQAFPPAHAFEQPHPPPLA